MKMTLSQALQCPADCIDDINPGCVAFSKSEKAATVAVWLRLLGLENDPRSASVRAATADVLQDPPLFIELNRSAHEFVEWFRKQAWDCFDIQEVTGGDEWAFTVLMNAKAQRDEMGPLASQMAITGARRK